MLWKQEFANLQQMAYITCETDILLSRGPIITPKKNGKVALKNKNNYHDISIKLWNARQFKLQFNTQNLILWAKSCS